MYNASVPSTLSLEVQGLLLFLNFTVCMGGLFFLIGNLFFNYSVNLERCFSFCSKKKKNKKKSSSSSKHEELLDSSSSSSGEEGIDKLREQIQTDRKVQSDFMKNL
jgi:hypothetical protein